MARNVSGIAIIASVFPVRDDFAAAVRNLRKQGRFTLLVTLTLGVGIACTTAMFSVVRAVLLTPLPWPDADRLAFLGNVPPGSADVLQLSYREVQELQELVPELEIGTYSTDHSVVEIDGRPHELGLTWVSVEVFRLLGARATVGRVLAPEEFGPEGPATVMIGHELWTSAFGNDRGVLGRPILVDGEPREIVGVLPQGFALPGDLETGQRTQLWAGSGHGYARGWSRQTRMFPALARLRDRATFADARSRLESALADFRRRHAEHYPDGWALRLTPVEEHLFGELGPTLEALFAAVGFVLLIACSNVSLLLVARYDARRSELAVRNALGAGRRRLLRQLMLESLLLALGGGLLGLLGARLAVSSLLAFGPGQLPRLDAVGLDATVLTFGLVAAISTTVVFGLVPALTAAGRPAAEALRRGRGAIGSLRARSGRRALLATEVALAAVLLVGSGLLVRSLRNLATTDLGFAPESLVAVGIAVPRDLARGETEAQVDFWERLRSGAERQAGIAAVSSTTMVPFASEVFSRPLRVEGSDVAIPRVSIERAGPGLATTFGSPLVRGRDLGAGDDGNAPPVALVSRALANRLGDALGARVSLEGSPWIEIVGVVEDRVHDDLEAIPAPRIVLATAQLPALGWRIPSFQWIVARAHPGVSSADALDAVRATARSLRPGVTTSPAFSLEDHLVDTAWARYRFAGFVLGIFSLVALGLALVGIYGLLACSVRAGHREIGLRLALGASPAIVARQVTREGLGLGIVGLALGLPVALATCHLLEAVLYGVRPTDLSTFLTTGALLLATTALAAAIPAQRAAAVAPTEALRAD